MIVALAALAVTGCSGAEDADVSRAEWPDPIVEHRADPWAYLHSDGYYYFTGSVPEYDRIELRRAKTLEGLGEAAAADVWRKPDVGLNSNLYIGELENPWTLKGEQTLISKPDLAWERIGFKVNEGAAVLKRNGKIFVAYSGSATDANYAMGLLTASDSSDLLDARSWTKSELPVFFTNPETGQYGPGHNSFTTIPDGKRDVLVYHARPYGEISGDPLFDPNRHARAQAFGWNEDGAPDFGRPGVSPEL
ncbi:family 43 glycosylhydrolase [Paenibacillaceae bacterium WGS1546]|uniref:glycoside hydrolase family 43 protein n=1 Tax=Cohnella sp. WGS1546 TaxID=3366810 RepID=UPI00372D4E1D